MLQLLNRFLAIDRRWIFLLMGLCILGPLLMPIGLPFTTDQAVVNIYDAIEQLNEGDNVIVSCDYDPGSKPERKSPLASAFSVSIGAVSDDDVVDGIRLLARTEGIFAETAGGVVVANLRQMIKDGALDPEAETVILNTGDGLKTLDAVMGFAKPTATIRPDVDEVRAAIS